MWHSNLNDTEIRETKRFIPKGFELIQHWDSRFGPFCSSRPTGSLVQAHLTRTSLIGLWTTRQNKTHGKKKHFSTCDFISLPYLLRERVLHLMALSEVPLLGCLCPVSKALCQVPWADCRHRCPVHHKAYPYFGDSQGKPDWMTEACNKVLLRVAVEVDVPFRYLQLPREGLVRLEKEREREINSNIH